MRGLDLEKVARLANIIGALSTTRLGEAKTYLLRNRLEKTPTII